jgi:hypothetical protein
LLGEKMLENTAADVTKTDDEMLTWQRMVTGAYY